MRKAVLDSTVLVSAFLTQKGPARELLHRAQSGDFLICLADEILNEARRVLAYPRLRKKYKYADEAIEAYLSLLRIVSEMTAPLPKLKGVVRDPNDDMIVACAVAAKAQHIVSRDNDLLVLGSYDRIEIVSPEDYMQVLRQEA